MDARGTHLEASTHSSSPLPFVLPGVTRILVFELQVTDDQGATGIDRVRIHVTR